MRKYIRQPFPGVNTLFPLGVRQPEELAPLVREDPRTITAIDLRVSLGEKAARIYGRMLGLRDDDRIAHPTRGRTATHFGTSESSVARVMVKLARVGLVEFLGKRDATVGGVHTPSKVVRCYCWRVLGVVYGGEGINQTILLPSVEMVEKIEAEEGRHGGSRPGAGRPRKANTGAIKPDNRATSKPGEGRRRKPAPMLALNQVVSPREAHNQVELPWSLRDLRKPYHAAGQPRARLKVKPRSKAGDNKRRRLLAWERAMTPPTPKPIRDLDGIPLKLGKLVPWVEIPPPPLVPEEATPADRGLMLIKAYRGVVKQLTGKRCHAYGKTKHLDKLKIFPTLVQAARSMESRDISPIQWAMWRLEEHFKQDGAIMPIGKVFAPAVIQAKGAVRDFWDEMGPRLPIHRGPDLITETHFIWKAMQASLRVLLEQGPTTKKMRHYIVDHYFPDGLWETSVQSCRTLAHMEQRDYTQQVNDGEWLW